MASQSNWADESQAVNDLSTLDASPGSTIPTPLSNINAFPPDNSRYPPDVSIVNNNDFRHIYSEELNMNTCCPNGGRRASGRPSSHNIHCDEAYPALSANGSPLPSSHFDKYLLLRFDESVNLDQINLYNMYDAITLCAGGSLQNIYRNNRRSYVLEASSLSQVQTLLPVTSIAGYEVVISVFATLNQCKGVATCQELNATPVEEIKAHTADQGVTYVHPISPIKQ